MNENGAVRYSFGGDSYVLAVIADEMSLAANLETVTLAAAAEASAINGVLEVCQGNASYLVHYDPDVIDGEALVAELKAIETAPRELNEFPSRLVDIPIWFDDPYTRENTLAYADRHQDPSISNLEFVARLNDLSPQELVERYCADPWIVSMVGFTPGTAFAFQMVPPDRVIEAPKWLSPRPFTPERCLGHGGAFAGIDPVDEPSGYQQLGRTPIPIYDPHGRVPALEGGVLARPGDRWAFRAITGEEYHKIRERLECNKYTYGIANQVLSVRSFYEEGSTYLRRLGEEADLC